MPGTNGLPWAPDDCFVFTWASQGEKAERKPDKFRHAAAIDAEEYRELITRSYGEHAGELVLTSGEPPSLQNLRSFAEEIEATCEADRRRRSREVAEAQEEVNRAKTTMEGQKELLAATLDRLSELSEAIPRLEEEAREAAEAERKAELKAREAERRAQIMARWGPEIGERIANRRIWLGMTDRMALDSWGYPDDINRTVNRHGIREQWVYRQRGAYLYFDDSVLTSWQD